jgi:1,4-dihydroxy-2-naphthoyl-CoA synthase
MEVAMGTESETNPPEVEIQAFSNALDTDNTALTLKKTWHKVTVKSVLLSQAGEQEFNIEMTCVAYQTDEDIEGAALSTKRIATIEVYS